MPYWKRQYQVKFPKLDYTLENSLHVDFDIQKDLTAEVNKSTLTIYNMNAEHREKVSQPDTECEIYAGYEGNSGPVCIFKGTVKQATSTYEEHDIKTELKLGDGEVEVRDSYMSLSYPPGTPIDTTIKAIARNMGLALEYGEGVEFGSWKDGYSYVGPGWTALRNICYGSGVTPSIQNGIIQIILDDGVFTNKGIVFSASTGLIGYPERINQADPYADKKEEQQQEEQPKRRRKSSKKKAKKAKIKKKAGWRIKTLMAPTVNPGDSIKVESQVIKGWFKVESLHHRGSYIGGDWVSEFDIVEGATQGDGSK